MKKLLLSIVIAVTTLASCSKDDEGNKTNNSNSLKYTQSYTYNSDNSKSVHFNLTYSGGKLISIDYPSTGSDRQTTYQYVENKLKTITYQFGINQPKHIFELAYSGDNVISLTEQSTTDIHKYTYNASNQLTEEKVFKNDVLVQTFSYKYNNQGNISEKTNTGEGEPLSTRITTYEYDTYNSPALLMHDEAVRKINGLNKNNVIKETTTENGSVIESNSFTYKYNDQGYPIESTNSSGNKTYLKYE